jgi:CheY-like chemotaxis protein
MARKVLIVDDDPDARDMMAMMLEGEGFEPSTAANGRVALDRLASGFHPDVILLDLMMPVLDGRQFLEQFRRDPACATIPVVVLSAANDRFPPMAADAVFAKPVDFARVLDAVRRYARHDDPTDAG